MCLNKEYHAPLNQESDDEPINPTTLSYCREVREEVGKMSQEERGKLFDRGMRIVYGCQREGKCEKGITDIELSALAALTNVEAVLLTQDASRAANGKMPATEKLRSELTKRGVL